MMLTEILPLANSGRWNYPHKIQNERFKSRLHHCEHDNNCRTQAFERISVCGYAAGGPRPAFWRVNVRSSAR